MRYNRPVSTDYSGECMSCAPIKIDRSIDMKAVDGKTHLACFRKLAQCSAPLMRVSIISYVHLKDVESLVEVGLPSGRE